MLLFEVVWIGFCPDISHAIAGVNEIIIDIIKNINTFFKFKVDPPNMILTDNMWWDI